MVTCERGDRRIGTTGAPSNTGPSRQERRISTSPDRSRTGTTQVKHTPTPHAMRSSSDTRTGTPRLPATAETAASMVFGPQA